MIGKNKGCLVVGKSAPDSHGRIWFRMEDNWIIPNWKNYIIINRRTEYGHQLVEVMIEQYPIACSLITVDHPEMINVGDVLEVMLSTPHTESETRGCECDDCKAARLRAKYPQTFGLPDEEINEIFNVIPPKESLTWKQFETHVLNIFFPNADPELVETMGRILVTPQNAAAFNKLWVEEQKKFHIIKEAVRDMPLESYKMYFIDEENGIQGASK